MRMKNLTYVGYFNKQGWTPERENNEILWLEGEQLEAIKIQSDVALQVEAWCPIDNVWSSAAENEIVGTIKKGKGLSAIKIRKKEVGANIYYRAYLRGCGWTAFCIEGECCGVDDVGTEAVIEGIQMFCLQEQEDLNRKLQKAEEMLEEYTWKKAHLFVHNPEKLLLAYTKNYMLEGNAGVKEVERGVLLPLKQLKKETRDGIYGGGVLDSELNWVAGLERKKDLSMNLTCLEGYPIKEQDIEKREEVVVFGGIFFNHFGHLFTECLSRLWYVASNEVKLPVAVLAKPGEEDFLHDFIHLLGIDDERLIIIERPVRFSKIIVPDQTFRLWSDFRKEHITIYDKILENIVPDKREKVYLTRTALTTQDGINEQFFEKFFEKRGYEVISPEKLSIPEQLSLLTGAKEIICTEGTLSHLGLFCKKGTKLTIIRRTIDTVLTAQLIINQARGLKVTYIDATHNFLPVKHSGGIFLYGPTQHFREYLEANKIDYLEEELDFHPEDFCYEYLYNWCKNYRIIRNFTTISKMNIVDLISSLSQVFGEEELVRKEYKTYESKKIKELKQEIVKLQQENSMLKDKLM